MSRKELLASIANTIKDYRAGEIAQPDAAHVDHWVKQFPAAAQDALLRETDHVLKQTYLNKDWVAGFLSHQVKNDKLAGADPCDFWNKSNFLSIQQNGHSQEDMLALFSHCLKEQCGLKLVECGSPTGPYIYLDDVIFSGSRVGNDLEAWIKEKAPETAAVHILVIAVHLFGEYKLLQRLRTIAAEQKKKIEFRCWRALGIENRHRYRDRSEVLLPAALPDDDRLKKYMAEEQKFPFEPRKAGGKLAFNVFSGEEGRQLLERELLLAGVQIRGECKNPKAVMRPLGFSPFGLGFGSMIVTFRNCPNNAPLALWWGDPTAPASSPLSKWYPLLPRKTYAADVDFDAIPF